MTASHSLALIFWDECPRTTVAEAVARFGLPTYVVSRRGEFTALTEHPPVMLASHIEVATRIWLGIPSSLAKKSFGALRQDTFAGAEMGQFVAVSMPAVAEAVRQARRAEAEAQGANQKVEVQRRWDRLTALPVYVCSDLT